MKVSALDQTGPEYRGEYWEELEALYRGGERLLRAYGVAADGRTNGVLTRVLPKHASETNVVYAKRLNRAVYLNYAGEILDYFVAKLQEDPIRLEGSDEWLQTWATKPTLTRDEPITRFMACQMRDLLVYGAAWAMVDLPRVAGAMEAASLAEQDAIGAREAYVQNVCPLSVIDWEVDQSGAVTFAVIRSERSARGNIGDKRQTVRKWLVIDARGVAGATWREFEYVAGEKQDGEPEATMVAEGVFAVMPLIMRKAKDGLWIMDKLESAAAEHLRKTSNIAFFEANSLNQDLYEFLDTSSMGVSYGEDESGSAKTDKYGPGWVHTRKAGDRVEYVAPKSDVFRYAIESADNMRDEIHRICYMSALSLSQTGQSFARSAESRSLDKEAESIIIAELGRAAKSMARSIVAAVVAMRGGTESVDGLEVCGAEEFGNSGDAQTIESASAVQALSIPSKRFRELMAMRVVKAYLANDVSDEDLELIAKEIAEGTEAHAMTPGADMPKPTFADEPDDGDDEADDEADA